MKNGRYEEARTKLDAAHERFTAQWSNDEKAQKVLEDVRFGFALDEARNALEESNLDAAQSKVKEALDIRPKTSKLRNLRDKIQMAFDEKNVERDKAEVGQHRRNAKQAVAAENLRGAVDEILEAYAILEKPSNASWAGPDRVALGEMAKSLVAELSPS